MSGDTYLDVQFTTPLDSNAPAPASTTAAPAVSDSVELNDHSGYYRHATLLAARVATNAAVIVLSFLIEKYFYFCFVIVVIREKVVLDKLQVMNWLNWVIGIYMDLQLVLVYGNIFNFYFLKKFLNIF